MFKVNSYIDNQRKLTNNTFYLMFSWQVEFWFANKVLPRLHAVTEKSIISLAYVLSIYIVHSRRRHQRKLTNNTFYHNRCKVPMRSSIVLSTGKLETLATDQQQPPIESFFRRKLCTFSLVQWVWYTLHGASIYNPP